jgi:hypothetical protein
MTVEDVWVIGEEGGGETEEKRDREKGRSGK